MQKFYLACYSLLLLILLFAQFFRPLTALQDDLGRQLLWGNIIVTTHTVPQTNLLSYTFPDYPFLTTSWLSEVIFSLLVQYGGFFLLLSLMTTIALLACFLQILYVKKHVSLFALLLTATLYIPLLMLRSDVRPELFSMLFLSLFLTTLYTFRQNPSKRIFFLVLFELLWVNMHIYFFIGPFLVLLFFLEDMYHHRFKKTAKTPMYSLVFAGTLLATLCNPNGIHGALAPLTIPLQYGMPVLENQNIYTLLTVFQTPGMLYPLFVIFLLWSLLFFQRNHISRIDVLLAILFGIAALVIYRNILLFTFLTFIPFTLSLDNLLFLHPEPQIQKNGSERSG